MCLFVVVLFFCFFVFGWGFFVFMWGFSCFVRVGVVLGGFLCGLFVCFCLLVFFISPHKSRKGFPRSSIDI